MMESDMTSTTDRILDLIDAGLQSSTEVGEGHSDIRRDLCARCVRSAPVEGGDLCTACRAFLLEDSDADPMARRPAGTFIQDCIVTPEQHDGLIRGDDTVTLTFEGCTFELEWIASSPLTQPYQGPARGPHADQYSGSIRELPRDVLESLTCTGHADLQPRHDVGGPSCRGVVPGL